MSRREFGKKPVRAYGDESPAAEPESQEPAAESPAAEPEVPAVVEPPRVLRRFVVTFNPPSPIGEKAARMEVEAYSEAEAVQQWREATGFLGALAVLPVATLASA